MFSCSGKNKIPAEIIQQKEMQDILWDVIRAQAFSAEIAHKDSSVSEVAETKMLTQKVFEIHHITSSAFEQSYSWYTSHPEIMRIIFDSMNIQNQRQNDLKSRGGYKPMKKDSINKIKAVE
ncbi:MAG: DUF4296 domain-containing protein [Ginsengibacter sp.]